MLKQHSEIKMIWLMLLIIVAISTWVLALPIITFLCVAAFLISVMQYAHHIEKPLTNIEQQTHYSKQNTSRLPLYISSFLALIGSLFDWTWLVGLGLTFWIYFFLNWLRQLEGRLIQIGALQEKLIKQDPDDQTSITSILQSSEGIHTNQQHDLGFGAQIRRWIFHGNPVLKVAITVLVIGVVLLLRYMVEHWTLSLSIKLLAVAVIAIICVAFGYHIQKKNRGFGLALQGLGFAGLLLSILFAYHYDLLNLINTITLYSLSMLSLVILILKQRSVELSLMGVLVAYIAPFTLPHADFSSAQLLSYYLAVNCVVGVICTLHPWKILTQIALLLIVVIGGGYAFLNGGVAERFVLSCLVIAHASVFIWLGFRFNQLATHQNQAHLGQRIIDSALIYVSPLVAYAFLHLMYLDQKSVQIALCLGFALTHFAIFKVVQHAKFDTAIKQNYLMLGFIFLSFIPPILIPQVWSVIGWIFEGLLILMWGLHREFRVGRTLGYALLTVGLFSYLYYLIELASIPNIIPWLLGLSYILAIVVSNVVMRYQKQLTLSDKIFLSIFSFFASLLLLYQGVESFSEPMRLIYTLAFTTAIYFAANFVLQPRQVVSWSWLLPKWLGLIPIVVFAAIMLIDQYTQGVIVWQSFGEQGLFILACLGLSYLWLKPISNAQYENEWIAFGGLASLACASVGVVSMSPMMGAVLLPLILYGYSVSKTTDLNKLWLTKTSLILLLCWIVSSQIWVVEPFWKYFIPILNPIDFVSLTGLWVLIQVLRSQIRMGLERTLGAFLILLAVLWVSSYVLLRALHFYFATPYNQWIIWQDSAVQLALTLLWVVMAFIVMKYAAVIHNRVVWMFGASILAIVTFKLVLLDLSHIGTLSRVLSFLGAGGLMLIIAYIAPAPEQNRVEETNA